MLADTTERTIFLVRRVGVRSEVPVLLVVASVVCFGLWYFAEFEIFPSVALLVIALQLLFSSIYFPKVAFVGVTSHSVVLRIPAVFREIEFGDIDKEKTRANFLAEPTNDLLALLFFPYFIVSKSGRGFGINRAIFDIGDVNEFLGLIGCE